MRALVLTMLDVAQEPNQRIHHVIRMLERTASETVVVTKVRAHGRSPGAMLRDALAFRIADTRAGATRTLAVHPPLNYAQAVAAGLVQGELETRPGLARRATATALSVLGIARDVALVPAFVLAILARTRGVFDVCVAQGPWEAAVGAGLRALGRVRRLIYDDIDFVAGGHILAIRRAYVGWLERTLIRRADAAVSSGWLLGALRSRTTGRTVPVVPNGVDPARFRRVGERRPHPPTLVYVGNVAHYAGVDLAITALPELRARIPGLRLVVVGGGDAPYLEALRRLATTRGVSDAVELRGPVPYAALPDVFAESDIGLVTFRPVPLGAFAFPLKTVEYMAAGLPVIGTAGSETAELLARHPCGRAIPFDPDRFRDAVLELLTDPAEYARAAGVAVAAANEFTWAQSMDALRAIVMAQTGAAGQPAAR